jgi:predicted negative regulator of RcsB-dependent stress response
MHDILEEVALDTSYDKRVKIFKNILVASAVLGFVLIVSFSIYSSRQAEINKSNSEISAMLLKFIHSQNNDLDKTDLDKKELIEKIDLKSGNLADFAKLNLVALDLKDKNPQQAAKHLQDIILDKKSSELLKQYASIVLVSLALDYKDIIKNDDLEAYVAYIDKDNTPLQYNGKILKSLYLIQTDKKSEAKEILKGIITQKVVPESIKIQASAILASLDYSFQ